MSEVEPEKRHAVRWARRRLVRMFGYDWTRWHITDDATRTLCGVVVAIATDHGTALPDSDDDWATRADCKRCRHRADLI